MTILEHLVEGDWQTARRNFERLNDLFGFVSADSDSFGFKVADIGIRFGTSSLTWAAATNASNIKTVTHGLGKTPVAVGAWGSDATTAQFFWCYPFTFTTTQFSLRGLAEAAPGVQTKTFTWIAVG